MNILKKRGVAVLITLVMVAAAICIGRARAPLNGPSYDAPAPDSASVPLGASEYYIYDDADVLSAQTEEKLAERNRQLLNDLGVAVAVVTCNYGKSDLGGYAIDYAENIGLSGRDMIVVLDVSGDNYWLVQGADLVNDFTDDDCSDYAWSYMETDFARGDYDGAVLSLTQALADWYDDFY